MNQVDAISLDYRHLFFASPNAYLLLARDLTILDANAAYAGLVGIPRERLIGQQLLRSCLPGFRTRSASCERR